MRNRLLRLFRSVARWAGRRLPRRSPPIERRPPPSSDREPMRPPGFTDEERPAEDGYRPI